MGGSKTFQIRHWGKVRCLYISNVVNTKVAEFVKEQPHDGQIIYSLQKRLKPVQKMSFLISNYFSKSSLLIYTFAWPADYKKQKKKKKKTIARLLCLHYGYKNEGVNTLAVFA